MPGTGDTEANYPLSSDGNVRTTPKLTSELKSKCQEIMAFDIDGGPTQYSFSKRLSRENGWTLAFAERVINEYKRFIFLLVVTKKQLTPSDQVDQAWHLHLTYTISYWKRLCDDLLGQQLHHHPTRGGADENAKFDDWYKQTLEQYDEIFGEQAPTDIWPQPEVRFGEDLHFRRVNTRRNWIISRPPYVAAMFRRCGHCGGFAMTQLSQWSDQGQEMQLVGCRDCGDQTLKRRKLSEFEKRERSESSGGWMPVALYSGNDSKKEEDDEDESGCGGCGGCGG